MSSLREIFGAAAKSLSAGENVMYVSIIASSGSTPRGAGATMMVFPSGESIGTIGGGAVEFAAQKRAAELLREGKSECVGYVLDRSDVENLGMICGGDVTVYFQYLDAKDGKTCELMEYVTNVFDKNTAAWLIRRVEEQQVTAMGVFDEGELRFTDCITKEQLSPCLTPRTTLIAGEPGYYIEPLTAPGRVFVFGGGHVAQQLVPVIAHLGFRVTLFEDREQFAAKELFPDAEEIIQGDFARIGDYLTITEDDYVIIMTRGHQMDFELLAQTIPTPACYIGCIGSAKKVAATKEKLAKLGITGEMFEKVATPIGLEIGARTPEEIAISIAAQLIERRAKKKAEYKA